MDCKDVKATKKSEKPSEEEIELIPYGQKMPDFNSLEDNKKKNPPILPPHLLQVLRIYSSSVYNNGPNVLRIRARSG